MTRKPSEQEDEYFARLEFERQKQIEEEKQHHLAKKERQHLKNLHYMHCPKCGMQLVEIDYRNLKVDKCTECDGVWLDAGELEAVAQLDKPGMTKFFSVFRK